MEHGWAAPGPERHRNVPNTITLVRTIGAVVLGVLAFRSPSIGLMVAGYGVYWAGDILDGLSARLLKQETRFGGVADVVCDRICTLVLGCALIAGWPWLAPAIVLFLVQFVAIDLALSLSFLRWPILSPNYFSLVDRPIYTWNWSMPAKAVNSASVLLLAAVTGSVELGVAAAVAGTVVKVVSVVRLVGVWQRVPVTIGPAIGPRTGTLAA